MTTNLRWKALQNFHRTGKMTAITQYDNNTAKAMAGKTTTSLPAELFILSEVCHVSFRPQID